MATGAFLILFADVESLELVAADVWSDPPWEKSRIPGDKILSVVAEARLGYDYSLEEGDTMAYDQGMRKLAARVAPYFFYKSGSTAWEEVGQLLVDSPRPNTCFLKYLNTELSKLLEKQRETGKVEGFGLTEGVKRLLNS